MSTASIHSASGKSSLREFQQRLASRLTQAKNTQVATHLAVYVGSRHLLLPLAEAGEITNEINVQPLPHAKPWFLGVTVLRGQIVGVADLAVLLGERVSANASGTFVAIAGNLEVNCLLRVDKLSGLRTLDQFSVDQAQARGELGNRYKDDSQVIWEELSLAALAQDEQFLQVFT